MYKIQVFHMGTTTWEKMLYQAQFRKECPILRAHASFYHLVNHLCFPE